MQETIAVVGLGYVGLPVTLAIARHFPGTIGFDINAERVASLRNAHDHTGETTADELRSASIEFTTDEAVLKRASFFIVAVPTPVNGEHVPDLTPVIKASETVGRALRPGSVVVYESTVYPGVTEDICGPLLARISGLRQKVDFKLGYSPERINPGDRQHSFEKITKVVSGEDPETLERVAQVYGSVVEAGVYKAPTIRVAEAAKVIENVQRDLNIALMNELSLIFDRLGIRTREVLDAASTKWNFLRFEPGLVGGHCIGVDPYYLTTAAEAVGYHPQVILAGRRINESVGAFVAQKVVKLLAQADVPMKSARVGILGLTFKPDVSDLRNTKVVDIVSELRQYAIEPLVHDPLVSAEEVRKEYMLRIQPWDELHDLHALVLAVPHSRFMEMPPRALFELLLPGGVLIDVKSVIKPSEVPEHLVYWSL